MYWDSKLETINREELEALQFKRLIKTLKTVTRNVNFYKEKFKAAGVSLKDIKTLADVKKLPFTTGEDLKATYPDGLLAIKKEAVIRLHTSSGTTGKPKAIFFSAKDIDNAAELMARCFVMTGVTSSDVFQNMMTYGLFTGALVMHYGAEKLGVLVIPAGPGNSERQLTLMKDFKTTVIHITPSYALYFSDFLEKKGISSQRDLSLKRAFIGAEPHTEETRQKIENLLGIDAYNSYGLSEMNGPGVAFECIYKNGMHIWEDNFLVEIIDPATGEPLPEGEKGELVLTTLNREAMPLIRYRTRDITSIIPEPCKCGRTHRRLTRITGRTDDMLIVRGVNIFPQQIEKVLMSIPGVGKNYLIKLDGLDEMTVQAEFDLSVFDGQVEHLVQLQNQIVSKLNSEILIKPKVELVPPGSLAVSEGKAKRVIDNRKI